MYSRYVPQRLFYLIKIGALLQLHRQSDGMAPPHRYARGKGVYWKGLREDHAEFVSQGPCFTGKMSDNLIVNGMRLHAGNVGAADGLECRDGSCPNAEAGLQCLQWQGAHGCRAVGCRIVL